MSDDDDKKATDRPWSRDVRDTIRDSPPVKDRSSGRQVSGTKIKLAAQSALGDLLVRHLVKIVIGLGAVIGLVWQLSGDATELKHRLNRVEERQLESKNEIDDLKKRVDRLWYRVGRRPPLSPMESKP